MSFSCIEPNSKRLHGAGRKVTNYKLDEELTIFISERKSKGLKVSRSIITIHAEKLAKKMVEKNPKFSLKVSIQNVLYVMYIEIKNQYLLVYTRGNLLNRVVLRPRHSLDKTRNLYFSSF